MSEYITGSRYTLHVLLERADINAVLTLLCDESHNCIRAYHDQTVIYDSENMRAKRFLPSAKGDQNEKDTEDITRLFTGGNGNESFSVLKYVPLPKFKHIDHLDLTRVELFKWVESLTKAIEFLKMSHLKVLILSENQLTCVEFLGKSMLKSLVTLDLSCNNISNLGSNMNALQSLETLNISNNPMEGVEPCLALRLNKLIL